MVILYLLAPASAISVELGQIEVNSRLNQPFHAQIPIEAAGARRVESIHVGLAAPLEFARLALDRPFWLDQLRFDLELGQDRNGRIVITSQEVVREPYVEFVLEVKWSKGRLLRKYAAIVDLPVDPVKIGGGLPSRYDGGKVSSTGRKTVARYGPVAPGESLWTIASKVRPNSSTSVRQMMNALLEKNPSAFISHDINRLKKDVVLAVPEIEGEESVVALQPPVTGIPMKSPDTGVVHTSTLQAKTDAVTEQSETVSAGDVIVNTPSARPDDKLRSIPPRILGIQNPASSAAQPSNTGDDRLLSCMAENAELKRRTAEIEDSLNHMENQLETMQQLLAALTDFHQRSGLKPSALKPEKQSPRQLTNPLSLGLSRVKSLDSAKGPILNSVIHPVGATGQEKKAWWLVFASALLGGLLILTVIIGLLKWGTTWSLPAKA
ncbi:MAG: hypothetical protein GY701_05805 [Sulfitobacter sp.]|nr:hypothetical protein [Sulfitobacter sp.]